MKPHRARIIAMQALFQYEFLLDHPRLYKGDLLNYLNQYLWIDHALPDDEKVFLKKIINGTIEKIQDIDEEIQSFSMNWDFSRISRVAKAILRISIYQLMDDSLNVPKKVTIDEGICLTKEFAEEDAKRFVNGILDGYFKELSIPMKSKNQSKPKKTIKVVRKKNTKENSSQATRKWRLTQNK